MRIPTVSVLKFAGKAVLVLEDNHQYSSRPLGFMEKCPLIAIGEPFILPDGKNAGTVTEINASYANNELIASCSFKTDIFPFSFKVHADAREVATYYQRTVHKRFEKSLMFIHHLEIRVSEGFSYRSKKYPEEVLYLTYDTVERYKQDTFEAFLEESKRSMLKDLTLTLYGTDYKVTRFSYTDKEIWTMITLTDDEAKVFRTNTKRRWYKSYRDSSGRTVSTKTRQTKYIKGVANTP